MRAPDGQDPARQTTAHRMSALLREAQERVWRLVDDDAPDRRLGVVRALRLVAVGVLAAALGCALVGALVDHVAPAARYDEPSLQRFKHRAFAARKDELDVVFVGTSRVYRQLVPALFDELTAQAGHPTRSFNFGLRGMPHPEVRRTVSWILEREPAELDALVIELGGELVRTMGRPLHEENALTDRVIAWHDARRTALVAAAALAADDEPLALRLDAVIAHLFHFVYRATNTGVGLSAAATLLGYEEEVPARPYDADGHVTFAEEVRGDPEGTDEMERWLETFRTDTREYDAKMAELRAAADPPPPHPRLVASLRAMAAEVRAAGVEPIFVLMPPHWIDGTEGLTEVDLGAPLLAYTDPERYPEFYALENLHNLRHLNGHGAELFTRVFAADFLRLTGSPP